MSFDATACTLGSEAHFPSYAVERSGRKALHTSSVYIWTADGCTPDNVIAVIGIKTSILYS